MNLPRVLIVDDQYGSAHSAWMKRLFLERTGLVEKEGNDGVALAVFCSGQITFGDGVENNYDTVKAAVEGGGREGEGWALVILDMRFTSGRLDSNGELMGQAGDDNFGKTVRQRLAQDFPSLPVALLTSTTSEEAKTPNIVGYLSKRWLETETPEQLAKLRHEIEKLLLRGCLMPDQKRKILKLDKVFQVANESVLVVAEAEASLRVFEQAYLATRSDAPILLQGESSTGKEVAAKYIHHISNVQGAFVAINCGAIPENLLESEIFGHKKGSFTGAVADKLGVADAAKGGTLFLDEFGDLSKPLQVKLLRLLRERKFSRVGEADVRTTDARFVLATHRNLRQMVDEGAFREDIFNRIKQNIIVIPPLRERRKDIVPMAVAFLRGHANKDGIVNLAFSSEALRYLETSGEMDFPGNVQDLKNLIERLYHKYGGHDKRLEISEVEQVWRGLRDTLKPAVRRSIQTETVKGDFPVTASQPSPDSEAKDVERRGATLVEIKVLMEDEQTTLVQLAQLLTQLETLIVSENDDALEGIIPSMESVKNRFEEAVQFRMKYFAGAVLKRFDPSGRGDFNQAGAATLLAGVVSKNKDPRRLFNKILGETQDRKIPNGDLASLVRLWREGPSLNP